VASLVNTFPQAFLEVLRHSLQHGGRNCCHFFPDVLFQVHRCPWFLFVHLALEISPEEEVLRLGTLVPMNIEVPTKYQLSHDRIVFENRLHSENPMLYRPVLHGNWNALSRARRALKDKFPTPMVPLTAVLPNCQVFLPYPILLYYIMIILYHIYFLRLLFVRWTTTRSRWKLVSFIWLYNLRCIASSNNCILWPEDGLTKRPKHVVNWNK
jgi:hypothetical protein